jgi:5-(carboxyamino)imidazole ribonucleotide synthase
VTFPVVGVVGGGQLARMMAEPANALGIRLRLLAERADDSAAQVIPDTVIGSYRDLDTLRRFARECDVVTFDHEHVPQSHLAALVDDGAAVRPGPHALRYAQDKGLMRERLARMNVAMPAWSRVSRPDDVESFAKVHGWPVVIKATSGGYDGKGVWIIPDSGAATEVLAHSSVPGFLVEEMVRFDREIAAVVARSPSNQAVVYPVVETVQQDGVCREVYAPWPSGDDERAVEAQRVALLVAAELDVVGVLAVEMFDTGARGILVNELAMRPHNSGHWTQDGATTSQFENHLRAVLDLPLGSPAPRSAYTVMVNVLGSNDVGEAGSVALADLYPAYRHVMARDPQLRVHVYGKSVRPGRKVGHVNASGPDFEAALGRARHAAQYLRGDIDE